MTLSSDDFNFSSNATTECLGLASRNNFKGYLCEGAENNRIFGGGWYGHV